jgi:hypothetical protein
MRSISASTIWPELRYRETRSSLKPAKSGYAPPTVTVRDIPLW